MKLNELKPLNEYRKGSSTVLPSSDIQNCITNGKLEKYYFYLEKEQKVKIEDEPMFGTDHLHIIVMYSHYLYHKDFPMYVFVDKTTKEIYSYVYFKRLSDDILQEQIIVVSGKLRRRGIASSMYVLISHLTKCWLINGTQLSDKMEMLWEKIALRIYNTREEKFYNLSEYKNKPKEDYELDFNQEWFYAFKETRDPNGKARISELFDFDKFLNGTSLFMESVPDLHREITEQKNHNLLLS